MNKRNGHDYSPGIDYRVSPDEPNLVELSEAEYDEAVKALLEAVREHIEWMQIDDGVALMAAAARVRAARGEA